jgi:glycosyltransferase involved in cell wall biosynthesis
MKIALVVDPYFPIPTQKYGGIERVVSELIKGLKSSGHHIVLFGPGDSQIDVPLVSCCKKHLNTEIDGVLTKDVTQAIHQNEKNILQEQKKFDIIHWHAAPTTACLQIKKPILITPHILYNRYPIFKTKYFPLISKLPHTSISKSYQTNFPELNYVGNVYNGVANEKIPLSAKTEGYVAFIGSFTADKQPHLAVEWAIKNQVKIKVAGRIHQSHEKYFEEFCQPLFNNQWVQYVGELGDNQRNEFLGKAVVNFHLINFEEPFGLTVVEAGLTGTPTIAFRKGSMPEIIRDGVSGYLAQNLSEVLSLYEKAKLLDRNEVRNEFERFNTQQMTEGYEQIYTKLALP